MYRYYSTEYPIRPDTFPLFANTVVSFKEKRTFRALVLYGATWNMSSSSPQESPKRAD